MRRREFISGFAAGAATASVALAVMNGAQRFITAGRF
jgi:hypothetical protein